MAPFLNPAQGLVNENVTLIWLRRDLRIIDNAALYHALKGSGNVLPVFVFDTEILKKLEDKDDKRVTFIYQSLAGLKADLERLGTSLLVLHGNPVEIFNQLSPKAVFANHDYESYALKRDEAVGRSLLLKGVPFSTFKDHVISEKNEVLKSDGKPYTVFTPYSKQWKNRLTEFYTRSFSCEQYYDAFLKTDPLPFPPLHDLGFEPSAAAFPEKHIPDTIIETYDKTRDYPGLNGTSRLGAHLRFGTVSIRRLVRYALEKNETWLNELVWREFYSMILWHFPHVEKGAFRVSYDRMQWRNDEAEYLKWCEGNTGYPIVDAGMRELNETGYMHNRVRMITASFLTKHLLIDWRWGEAWFARKLLDYDLPSNNGGWQWAAGCGCDAAPYFRVFNPDLQAAKFDPDGAYIQQWVPEYKSDAYKESRIVDHAFARNRTINVYRQVGG
jgi:deoxyribodipyrimidine photo-lyase